MASSSSSLSAGSSSIHSWKYDVFLSFRGEDTRTGFTDHLHAALRRYGIITFIDDQLNRGEQVSAALLQRIEESRFSIIIFSENYASSSWCLDELTKILECVKMGRHTALPVFYKVDPSDVRKQTESYAEAFEKHEEAYKDNKEKVRRWREALNEASGYSGWDVRNRLEYNVIEEIAVKILKELNVPFSNSSKVLVGIDSRGQKVLSLLGIGSEDVRMVGIWGMPGIGKTTIAKFVYQQIYTQFEGSCFISSARKKSQDDIKKELLSSLVGQSNLSTEYSIGQMFCSRKVLIVFDDVDHHNQLEDLVGNHNWFGLGSRIIVTTRDDRLLKKKDMTRYEVEELDNFEALSLFHHHAFKHELATKDFVEFEGLSRCALDYTKGIPLALEILGSFLYKRSKKEWESELRRVKRIPNEEVQQVFKISFDGLRDNEKNIFLDIACFFLKEDKDYVSEILESCDFSSEIGINILVEKALLTISNENKLCMHDLIQEMGWEIVRQQSIEDLGERSRLWIKEDVCEVLETNTGTNAIQGIVLDFSASEDLEVNVDVFAKMNKLRLLRFHNASIAKTRQYISREGCKLHLSGDFKHISNNLRYLCWHKYPLKSLPSKFYPKKLFELNMSFSRLEELWKGYKSFPKLTYIDLSYSRLLIKTPDFSGALELRRLSLEACTNLVEVHPSITTLEKLSFLNLRSCSKLKELPESIGKLTSLETLNLTDCSKLNKLPDDLGSLSCLESLLVDRSGIQELPSSINLLKKIQVISLAGCKGRESNLSLSSPSPSQGLRLPSLSGLGSLKRLKLSDCNLLEGALPSDLSSLYSLEYLNLSRNSFITLPSLTPLTKLHTLKLESCKSLQSLTELPSSIELVEARNCESLETFSYPRNSYASWESEGAVLDFYNCQRLLQQEQNVNMDAIIRSIPIATLFKDRQYRKYSAIIGGSGIPEWFIHRSAGGSIVVKLPPDFDDTRPLGLAFCASLDDNHLYMRAPKHSSEYENIWIGYVSFPPMVSVSDKYCGYGGVVSHFEGDGDEHPSSVYLKVSFFKYQPEAPDIKNCGIRLLYEPRLEDMMNEGTIEFVTVAAISCPPQMSFLGQPRCWRKDADFGYLGQSYGLGFEVEGYHEYEFDRVKRKRTRTETSLPLVEAPVAEADTSIDMPQPIQAPGSEDVQDISFLVTASAAGMSNRANVSPPLPGTFIEETDGVEQTLPVSTMQPHSVVILDHESESRRPNP